MNGPATTVRLAAVGDLLLAPGPNGRSYARGRALIAPAVRRELAACDVVHGNLECTLAGDGRCLATEPRLVATDEVIRAVRDAGFNLLSLANNHAFDCLESGFLRLRELLDELQLVHVGAGMHEGEAIAPAVIERRGLRLAVLAAVDQRSGPLRFAAPGQWGVAALDVGRLIEQIRQLRRDVHHVLVSIHWGEERFLVPSPVQIQQAHALVDAGASIVLGHHPHVLQGLEWYRERPILYSLGNFLADPVHFSDGTAIRWSRVERTGAVLIAEFDPQEVREVRLVPTYDSGVLADLDTSGVGARRLARASAAVARGVSLARYRREYLWVKTVQPAIRHLRWAELKRLRPRSLATALRSLLRASRAE